MFLVRVVTGTVYTDLIYIVPLTAEVRFLSNKGKFATFNEVKRNYVLVQQREQCIHMYYKSLLIRHE